MASHRHYDRPPIVEAVIDVKFDAPLTEHERQRAMERFRRTFPSIEEKQNIRVDVTPGGITTVASSAGFKMTAQNAVDVVLINEDSFGTVRLAPYEQWEVLIADARRNFDGFTKVVGRKKIVRMGVRFINRIDIPTASFSGRPLADFIRVGLDLPSPLVRVWSGFSLATNLVEASTGTKIVLQAGEIPAALIDHFSFRLDIDAYSDAEIPGKIDEMWDRAELLRSAKNAVFESCITDAARKLFE